MDISAFLPVIGIFNTAAFPARLHYPILLSEIKKPANGKGPKETP